MPTCPTNSPDGLEAVCAEAVKPCASSKPPGIQVWVFQRLVDARTGRPASGWELVDTRCETALPTPPTPAQIRAVLLSDSRFLPVPVSRVRTDPRSGRTVVNAEVVLSADTPRDYRTTVTVLGTPVQLDLSPQRWDWAFGDGGERSTDSPGRPYPAHDITHRYARPATVGVAVTVTWGGTFTVGATTYPIQGTTSVTGPPTPLRVAQARAELVPGSP